MKKVLSFILFCVGTFSIIGIMDVHARPLDVCAPGEICIVDGGDDGGGGTTQTCDYQSAPSLYIDTLKDCSFEGSNDYDNVKFRSTTYTTYKITVTEGTGHVDSFKIYNSSNVLKASKSSAGSLTVTVTPNTTNTVKIYGDNGGYTVFVEEVENCVGASLYGGIDYDCKWEENNDSDIFYFNTGQYPIYTIDLDLTTSNNLDDIKIYDYDTNQLIETLTSEGVNYVQLETLNQYYLRAQGDVGEYNIEVDVFHDDCGDSFYNAQYLYEGVYKTCTINNNFDEDKDYLKIHSNQTGTIKLFYSSTYAYFNQAIKVYDSNKNEVELHTDLNPINNRANTTSYFYSEENQIYYVEFISSLYNANYTFSYEYTDNMIFIDELHQMGIDAAIWYNTDINGFPPGWDINTYTPGTTVAFSHSEAPHPSFVDTSKLDEEALIREIYILDQVLRDDIETYNYIMDRVMYEYNTTPDSDKEAFLDALEIVLETATTYTVKYAIKMLGVPTIYMTIATTTNQIIGHLMNHLHFEGYVLDLAEQADANAYVTQMFNFALANKDDFNNDEQHEVIVLREYATLRENQFWACNEYNYQMTCIDEELVKEYYFDVRFDMKDVPSQYAYNNIFIYTNRSSIDSSLEGDIVFYDKETETEDILNIRYDKYYWVSSQ